MGLIRQSVEMFLNDVLGCSLNVWDDVLYDFKWEKKNNMKFYINMISTLFKQIFFKYRENTRRKWSK